MMKRFINEAVDLGSDTGHVRSFHRRVEDAVPRRPAGETPRVRARPVDAVAARPHRLLARDDGDQESDEEKQQGQHAGHGSSSRNRRRMFGIPLPPPSQASHDMGIVREKPTGP